MSNKKNGGFGFFGMLAAVGVGLAAGYGLNFLLKPEEKKEENKSLENEKEKALSISNTGTLSSTNQSNSLESFFCPISQEIMKDPVITKYGITYDRASILGWLEKSNTCPITRKPLSKEELIPNYTLKNIIEEYRTMHSSVSN